MKKFLILGRTGVGKSTYINAAFGVPVAKTDPFEACTKIVEHYCRNTYWGELTLIDTPGMAEDDVDRDDRYLSMIRSSVSFSSLDYVVYLSRLDETRLRREEKQALTRYTSSLGGSIWKKSLLVLTFAASVPKERYEEAFRFRSASIAEHIRSLDRSLYQFQFSSVSGCDSVVPNWHENCVSISSYLSGV